MAIATARDKFVHELSDLYDAEHQFLDGQLVMEESASDTKLRAMIAEHIRETKEQIRNLEQVFGVIGEEPKREQCPGALGLVDEANRGLQEAEAPELRDAMIGASAAKVEHYEMVSYADLIHGAELMGKRRAVSLLKANREQEVMTARRMERAGQRLLKRAMQSEGA